MKKRTLIAIVIPAVIIIALILYSVLSGKEKEIVLETEVQQGQFEIVVMVTGELQAIRETEIQAPSQLRSRNLRIRSVKIQDLIPEGTVVDSGDWVATLDRSEADNSLKDILDNLEQKESEYMRTKLDTTMQLRELRDELFNLKFAMEEAQITVEQSKYEPPATIRQAEIELEKAERAYDQAESNYGLRVSQARANMREAEINMARDRRSKEEMEAVLQKFDIYAPSSGMVIYKKDWSGEKRTAGTEINTWDLAVATLPDLSTMISMTYVNEIDISKLKRGQKVKIGVDAFPEKQFTGEVTEVANIGQQLPNTDAKVFEVRIELNERDSILRPSMTTSNQVITQVLDSVLFLPLEAVHANDSLTFVYTRDGRKQVVVLGESNENHIVVDMGLKKGEKLYLSNPDNPENFKYAGLELMDEIQRRKAEEEKQRREMQEQMNRPRQPRNIQGGPPQGRPQGEAQGTEQAETRVSNANRTGGE
ncbi:MAG: efflux RND transporter periplasmic adaptor subunit [Bacteroidales bacterium]|nr:efflux RND transporter periplasmic adaptor subunit [Bacteroidales bacterium]